VKIALLIFITASALFAWDCPPISYVQGGQLYIKSCEKCHGNGDRFAFTKTPDKWEALFADDAKAMIEAHAKVKKSKTYFKTKFKDEKGLLFDYLREYCYDESMTAAGGR
jgi:hypothetical protein